jgi:hypothetical protein
MMEFLKPIVERETQGRALFATVSGAHLYGFASPDSDFDVRGAHLLPLPQVVSLFPARETIEYSAVENGREIDLVSHDAAKFFGLMLKKNGYVMEQIFSPIVVLGEACLKELRPLAQGCITRHIYHHYRGFAENQAALLAKEQPKRAKSLLYLYRVLLTGIHVLQTGQIQSNLPRLLELYPQEGVAELIASKVREKAPLSDAQVAMHEAACQKLRAALEEAFVRSTLPENPERAQELDAYLVRLRLEDGR